MATEHRKALVCYARHIGASHEDAEDLAQWTLMKWLTHGQQIPSKECKAWLFMVLRNRFRSEYRRTRLPVRYGHLIDQEDKVDVPYLEVCQLHEIAAKLDTLSPRQQSVVAAFLDGLEYQEIAEKLHVRLGTVKSILFRVREALDA